tara:strand:- start:66 stop:383 length:318 start_codon:yes stop_codon:yes gene_type:complete
MISWEFFLKRRLKNNDGLRIWADNHDVETYEDLLECLNLEDVAPPTREQVHFLFETEEDRKDRLQIGKATKRFSSPEKETKTSSSSNPRDYGVYKAADQEKSDKS